MEAVNTDISYIGWGFQIDSLEARLTAEHPNWLGFCHNDLQCGNIMLDTAPTRLVRNRLARKDSPASFSQVLIRTLNWVHRLRSVLFVIYKIHLC